ncbi:hypothetical protein [Streptomyces sp. NPDC007206]
MTSVGAFICGIGAHHTTWLFLLLLAVAAFAAGMWAPRRAGPSP